MARRQFDGSVVFRPLLVWPGAATSDIDRSFSPFSSSWDRTLSDLDREVAHIAAPRSVVEIAVMGSTEADIRKTGSGLLAGVKAGPGAVVTLTHHDAAVGVLSFACDKFLSANWSKGLTDWQANVRAIALALEALRKVDRYGVTGGSAQYAGFKAIAQTTFEPDADAILIVESLGYTDEETFAAAVRDVSSGTAHGRALIRSALRISHPDTGGDPDKFRAVNEARNRLGWPT